MDRYYRPEDEVFNLGINDTAKGYMLEAARWAKFLAIVGLIISALFLLTIFFVLLNAQDISRQFGEAYGWGFGVGMTVFQLLSVFLIAYPSWTLLQFARKLVPAVDTANPEQLNEAFRNLKNTFRFWGILMIIIFLLYGIIIVFAILGSVLMGV